MKYLILPSTRFRSDVKRAAKRGFKIELLTEVIRHIANGEQLAPRYKDHMLSGKYADCHECHITPDWLLIYQIKDSELILFLTRTGTHADLF